MYKQSITALRPRILLMHQDLSAAARRCAQLTLAGFDAIEASDSIDALSVIRTNDVDLVLLNMPLEEMVAMDLPDVIRQIVGETYLPIIALVQEPTERQICRFLECGADEIVRTDASAAELMARIGVLLRIRELHEQLYASRITLQNALKREHELLVKLRSDNAHLQTLATTDPLTRVQNVRSFQDLLEHELKMALRYDYPLALLMLDVDHFKVVNDTFGHPSGDYVLKELAVILQRSVRESDVVGRTGGEEFSVLLPRANAEQAMQFAQRIGQEVAKRHFIAYGRDIHITVSLGQASCPGDATDDPRMLSYLADQALLTAKERGRDRTVAFCELDDLVQSRLRRQYQPAASV